MTHPILSIVWPVALGALALTVDYLICLPRKSPSPSAPLSSEGDNGFFEAVLSQYLAQDALHWSHVNTLTAIQAATLAGGYGLWASHQQWVAAAFVTLGFILTVALRLVVERNRQVRDVNIKLLEVIGRKRNPDWILNPSPGKVNHRRPVRVKGDQVFWFVAITLLVTDLALLWFVLAQDPPTPTGS